jgi:[ribosomal protein S18]-alanine N-acetyltransferase
MQLRDMTPVDLDAVLALEQSVHAHPWTRGMFGDALASGYLCKIYEAEGEMLGYVVLMPVLDEMHLLDISIAAARQRRGLGGRLLDEAKQLARSLHMQRMLLEVRPSNAAAIALYRAQGFNEIGRRRGYYPAENNTREDAIVMDCKL